ncbi:MAG: outer membrane factor, OMF family [Candidatus Magnetoglobus multicellularis str. Araruama]|uniref:Outer membrane factor, OMF family n=1 Tax=Candidatus Magnetoglobus multicellularis str. Araruama TaxID=890399 RepID=A0A1V1P6A2_9BACT|nr:MAG: outer membrane factor, OMF family [Candidatus Magnetoglobus multicellularis str. Araruama]
MKIYNILLYLMVLASIASAENKTLNLSDCIKIAHQNNPELLTYRESLIAYQHKEKSLFKDMLPDISLSWSGREVYEEPTDAYATTISVNQTLFNGMRNYTNWKTAGLQTQYAALEMIRQYQSVTCRVKKAWFNLLKTQELLDETTQSLERLKQHASNAAHFFKEGWIWRTDVLEAQVQVARGEQAKIVAENNLARAQASLNVLMHRDVNTDLNIDDHLAWKPNNWTYEAAREQSLTNRPDLIQAKIDLEKSQQALTIEKAPYYPVVSAKASWAKSDRYMDMHTGTENLSGQLSASWTIWEWGKTTESIAAAKATVRKNRLNIERIEDQLMLEIQETWLSVQEADKKVTVLKQALAQGKENYRVNIIRYRERLGTAKDVLDAQDLLTATRKDYISALAEYLTALANLDFAIGKKQYDIYRVKSK